MSHMQAHPTRRPPAPRAYRYPLSHRATRSA